MPMTQPVKTQPIKTQPIKTDVLIIGGGIAGCSLAFARSLGEFGAVIFIAGNQPLRTEIVALLTFIRLEEYNYQGAAAIATIMLAMAFAMLIVTNLIQAWNLRYLGRGEV